MDFKDKLKEVRKKRQLTLEDLSGLTGIPVSTLSSYEVGTRTPKEKQIKLIAEALKVSPFFFYDNSFSTDADVFLLLASLSLKGIIHFETENDEDGEIKPETLRIIVSDNDVIERLIRFIPLLQNKQGFEKTPAKYVKKNYKQYSDDLDDQINNTIINLITCDNVSDIVDNSVTSSQPDIATKIDEIERILIDCGPEQMDFFIDATKFLSNYSIKKNEDTKKDGG